MNQEALDKEMIALAKFLQDTPELFQHMIVDVGSPESSLSDTKSAASLLLVYLLREIKDLKRSNTNLANLIADELE